MKPQYSYYNQVTCTRDISGDNLNRGQMNFHWDNEGQSMFNPARSYFRVRCKLSQTIGGVTQPIWGEDDIAPNMYLMDNVFQQMRMRINGQTVSEIADYIPQISALKRRVQQSEHRARILGQTMEFSSGSFAARQAEVVPGCERSNHTEPETVVYQAAQATGRTDINRLMQPNPAAPQAQFVAAAGGVPDNIIVTNLAYPLSKVLTVGKRYITTNNGGRIFRIAAIIDNDTGTGGTAFCDLVSTNAAPPVAFVNAGPANIVTATIQELAGTNSKSVDRYARARSEFELIWHPCMGFWQINDFLTGKFNFELTPQSNSTMQKYVIESLREDIPDYNFEIVSMILYAYTGYTNSPYTGTLEFSMQECEMQQQNLTTASLTNKIFSVQPNTFALTLAFQTGNAGDDTRYSLTKFKLPLEQELSLARYYIQYKGIMLPRTIPDPQFQGPTTVGTTGVDYTKHNYYEMLQYSGAFDKTDCEDLYTWQQKGPFYHYEWPLQENEGTECAVSCQFSWTDPTTVINSYTPTVLLFSHYLHKLTLRCEGGRCKSVNA